MDEKEYTPRIGAVIVAAGTGSRMGTSYPKQYALIEGKTMLERSVEAILAEERITQVVIVISPGDLLGQQLKFSDPRVQIARVGGNTRADSVKNGIAFSGLSGADWVLSHDAARPCVRLEDISRLIDYCLTHDEGAILAVPVNDTIKSENEDGKIDRTVPRDHLWCAQTPQCFKVSSLSKAFATNPSNVTDEASVMESVGIRPALVQGSSSNIKVTRQKDLLLARAIFQARSTGENI